MKKSDLNTFDDINDTYLQAFNRLVVVFNLTSDNRSAEAREYLSQFDARSRVSVGIVTADIKQNGFTAVRKKISEKLSQMGNLVDSMPDEVLA